MTGVVAVVIVGLFGWATYAIAAYKGIASWVWFGIGVVLSPIGIVLALTAPSARHRREPAPGPPPAPAAAWSPPGWYPDPWRRALMRWYDGTHWTGYEYAPLSMPAPPAAAPRPASPAVVSKRRRALR